LCQVQGVDRLAYQCAKKNCSGNQFDFNDAILNALKGLQVDLAVDASLTLDDCKLCSIFASRLSHCHAIDATDLSFVQKGVTAIVRVNIVPDGIYSPNPRQTDQTALYLIGAVAAPVAQDLVNGAILAFSEANITYVSSVLAHRVAIHPPYRNVSNDGFDLTLQGSMTNIGPLDALIEFVDPVTYVQTII
jgi:hypothetical protein